MRFCKKNWLLCRSMHRKTLFNYPLYFWYVICFNAFFFIRRLVLEHKWTLKQLITYWGSGCGSVGRAVTSNTRGPRFESSHRQKLIYILNYCLLSTVYWKTKIKKKEDGNGPFFKKTIDYLQCALFWLLQLRRIFGFSP